MNLNDIEFVCRADQYKGLISIYYKGNDRVPIATINTHEWVNMGEYDSFEEAFRHGCELAEMITERFNQFPRVLNTMKLQSELIASIEERDERRVRDYQLENIARNGIPEGEA